MRTNVQKRNELLWGCAAIVAFLATLGSLIFSEVFLWVPCKYCWIQRIFMYALAWMLIVSHLRRQWISRWYIVPFVCAGGAFAAYHTYIQKSSIDPSKTTCQGEVSCYADYLNLFGWITIPMLALTAFVLIGICMALIKKEHMGIIGKDEMDGQHGT
ncbi:MAG: disulfide bond formation protein B [Paenibacillaceae bacterium]|jgi:disulfide bond formation protein DsbB|nr:disulfide bond formation protein B [Paenibacillaceae bacterium]